MAATPLKAHRAVATLQEDGTLTLEGLPFRAGESVEVVLLAQRPLEAPGRDRYPLRGTDVRYDRPTEPVALDDWDADR